MKEEVEEGGRRRWEKRLGFWVGLEGEGLEHHGGEDTGRGKEKVELNINQEDQETSGGGTRDVEVPFSSRSWNVPNLLFVRSRRGPGVVFPPWAFFSRSLVFNHSLLLVERISHQADSFSRSLTFFYRFSGSFVVDLGQPVPPFLSSLSLSPHLSTSLHVLQDDDSSFYERRWIPPLSR